MDEVSRLKERMAGRLRAKAVIERHAGPSALLTDLAKDSTTGHESQDPQYYYKAAWTNKG